METDLFVNIVITPAYVKKNNLHSLWALTAFFLCFAKWRREAMTASNIQSAGSPLDLCEIETEKGRERNAWILN